MEQAQPKDQPKDQPQMRRTERISVKPKRFVPAIMKAISRKRVRRPQVPVGSKPITVAQDVSKSKKRSGLSKIEIADVNAVVSDRFYENISKYTSLYGPNIEKYVTYVPFTKNITVADLNMTNTSNTHAHRRWGLLLYYQYVDMLHDYKRRSKTVSIGFLKSWEMFTNSLITERDYPKEIVESARKHVNRVAPHVRNVWFGSKNRNIGSDTLSAIHALVFPKGQMSMTPVDALLYIVLARTMRAKENKNVSFQNTTPHVNERNVLVDMLVYLSNSNGAYAMYKRNGVNNPMGAYAYKNTTDESRKNALLSLDMSRFGVLKQFTANYYTYVHLVNLGDPGIYFSPERDIRSILVNMIRKQSDNHDNSFKIPAQNMNNTRRIRTLEKNNFVTTGASELGMVTFDTRPFELVIEPGTMRVQVTNNPQHEQKKTRNSLGQQITNHVLNPVLTFNNDKQTYAFATAQTDMCNKQSTLSPYKQHMRKHLGDFLNATNCIQNNIIFASGDALACVGYLIAHVLMNSNCKLMWEDSRNMQIIYTHRTSSSTNTSNPKPSLDAAHIRSIDLSFAKNNQVQSSPVPTQTRYTPSKPLEQRTRSLIYSELSSEDFKERYAKLGLKKAILKRHLNNQNATKTPNNQNPPAKRLKA